MSKMTAWQFINRIHSALGQRPKEAVFEGRLNRNLYAPVENVLIANEPSIEAVNFALKGGHNTIVCRDHPYYLYGEHWTRGVEDILRDDFVVASKRKLIEDNGILILRLGALWDTARPEWFSLALAEALGWKQVAGSQDNWSPVMCDIGEASLIDLSRSISRSLGASAIRIVGERDWRIRRAAVIHGNAFPTLIFAKALEDPQVDAIVTGTTPEVDFGTTYIRDAIASGRKVALIQVGYERSQYPGALEVGEWLRQLFPDIPMTVQPQLPEQMWLA